MEHKARFPAARLFWVLVSAVLLLAAACAQEQEAAPTATPAEEGVVAVTLQEWAVVAKPTSAPAGEVTFEVTNNGEDEHEFMVFRTDLDPGELPTSDDGSVDEEGEGLELMEATNAPEHGDEEHEVVEPDGEKDFVYELEAGSYVLLCNLVEEETEDGETKTEVHYRLGMRTAFTVE